MQEMMRLEFDSPGNLSLLDAAVSDSSVHEANRSRKQE